MQLKPLFAVPFTQYLRPFGEKRPSFFDCDESLYHKAQRLIDLGCRFEIELLEIGTVSLECVYQDAPLTCELSVNGPGVEKTVEKIIDDALALLEGK